MRLHVYDFSCKKAIVTPAHNQYYTRHCTLLRCSTIHVYIPHLEMKLWGARVLQCSQPVEWVQQLQSSPGPKQRMYHNIMTAHSQGFEGYSSPFFCNDKINDTANIGWYSNKAFIHIVHVIIWLWPLWPCWTSSVPAPPPSNPRYATDVHEKRG